MVNSPETIFIIDGNKRTPKYLQIVHSVTKAIKQGLYKKGDRLLSINVLSNEFLLSRDTVQKAYDILEKERIIEAVKGKGFYISRTDLLHYNNILLIFNKLSSYKRMIYESFVRRIGLKGKVDLKIHHSNSKVLESIIDKAAGEYDYYVIMPHFYNDADAAINIIEQLPAEQVILLDKDLPSANNYTAIYQDFERDIREAMEDNHERFEKYNELILVFPDCQYPKEIVQGFKNFCKRFNYPFQIISSLSEGHIPLKGQAFVVIEDIDLANLIKSCRTNSLNIGEEVGILAYNDTPLKEILLDGISVISTDHSLMGEHAAELIIEQRYEKMRNPFRFIPRQSL